MLANDNHEARDLWQGLKLDTIGTCDRSLEVFVRQMATCAVAKGAPIRLALTLLLSVSVTIGMVARRGVIITDTFTYDSRSLEETTWPI
jgi:hypothetical protein